MPLLLPEGLQLVDKEGREREDSSFSLPAYGVLELSLGCGGAADARAVPMHHCHRGILARAQE